MPSLQYFPQLSLSIEGSPLAVAHASHVVRVTVEKDIGLPGFFEFELVGSDSQPDANQWMDDDKLFEIGNEVKIEVKKSNVIQSNDPFEINDPPLIIGEITGLEPIFSNEFPPRLIVRGYDRLHRLRIGQKTRNFVQQKDSFIVAKIADEAGLIPEVQDSQVKHEYVMQANQTDFEFLQERARQIQYHLFVEDRKLFFRPITIQNTKAKLTLANDILDFCPRVSALAPLSQVVVQGWDFSKKIPITKAKTSDTSILMGKTRGADFVSHFGGAIATILDSPPMSIAEAETRAQAQFNQSALNFITGEGVAWGRTDLQPAQVIQIDGLGKRFSGLYYVIGVTHHYTADGNFYTHFKVRRNAL
jgi:uncharacterized protein